MKREDEGKPVRIHDWVEDMFTSMINNVLINALRTHPSEKNSKTLRNNLN